MRKQTKQKAITNSNPKSNKEKQVINGCARQFLLAIKSLFLNAENESALRTNKTTQKNQNLMKIITLIKRIMD